MPTLTKKQEKVFAYIRNHIREHDVAPSLEEIQAYFGLASASTAHYYVCRLEEAGLVKRKENQPRGIELALRRSVSVDDEEFGSVSIPVYGMANAGPATVFAEENVEGFLKVRSRDIRGSRENKFAVRAEGNSMNRAKINGRHIESGDFVIIDGGYREPQDGDYVLSIIDNCANLKRFTIDEHTGQKMLVSESTQDYKPIFLYEGDDYMVNGKIIGVVRSVKK